jgi:hypothetical protein
VHIPLTQQPLDPAKAIFSGKGTEKPLHPSATVREPLLVYSLTFSISCCSFRRTIALAEAIASITNVAVM